MPDVVWVVDPVDVAVEVEVEGTVSGDAFVPIGITVGLSSEGKGIAVT